MYYSIHICVRIISIILTQYFQVRIIDTKDSQLPQLVNDISDFKTNK